MLGRVGTRVGALVRVRPVGRAAGAPLVQVLRVRVIENTGRSTANRKVGVALT